MIADHDAEDAYDVSDPPALRLHVLERVVVELRNGPDEDRRDFRIADALRLIRNLESVAGVDLIRLAELRDELEGL